MICTFSSFSSSSLGDQAEKNLFWKCTCIADVKRTGVMCSIIRGGGLVLNIVCSVAYVRWL